MASANTTKIAINNEIVLMRQAVRQSRVAVIRKLIKEAKLLQARKHGHEHVQEKCKRKAQRLLAEIAAIKKLKDDEISKFGITNSNKLSEVLSDTTAEPATRVMTRVTFHKILCDRITKFKVKFPEYEEHLKPGRKKLLKIQQQTNRQARNALRKAGKPGEANDAIVDAPERLENGTVDENIIENSAENSNDEHENNNDSENEIEPLCVGGSDDGVNDEPSANGTAPQHSLEDGSVLRVDTSTSTAKKRKVDNDSPEIESVDSASNPLDGPKKPKQHQTNELTTLDKKIVSLAEPSKKSKAKIKNKAKQIESKAIPEPKKLKPIKIVSKEATVKRFADLVDDKEPEECIEPAEISSSSKKRETKIEKEVDSFFMTENGESEYLSVVVPRPKPCNDDANDDRFGQNHAAQNPRNFRERNNKFFSKIDQRANGSYGDRFGANIEGRHGNNDFGNARGSFEKFGRNGNDSARPPRNGKPKFEKKIEPQDEELHPSWAARKKQQEILKQGPQGKKIVFDD